MKRAARRGGVLCIALHAACWWIAAPARADDAGATQPPTSATREPRGPAVDVPGATPLVLADARERACAVAWLQSLGWQFGQSGLATEVHVGAPCTRATPAEARAAGDLRVRRPAVEVTARMAETLLEASGSRCGYAFAYGDAARRAVDRLVANPGYRFTGLQLGWIGFAGGGDREWTRIAALGRGYVPTRSNAAAIGVFTDGRARSECGVGRQVAQYAALRELYGDAAFDQAFARDEIVVGTFNQHAQTRSVLLGTHRGSLQGDGLARAASQLGRQAFAGVPGFFYAVDRDALSDTANQAQNFVVYEVDDDAAAGLRAGGGFARYNAMLHRAWSIARAVGERGHEGYERLLLRREPGAWRRLDPSLRARVREIDALLGDRFFEGFRIYVHHHGVKPLRDHAVRMLDRNPGTAYRVELALHNVHGTLYRRYARFRIDACVREADAVVAAGRAFRTGR